MARVATATSGGTEVPYPSKMRCRVRTTRRTTWRHPGRPAACCAQPSSSPEAAANGASCVGVLPFFRQLPRSA
eukprot:4717267-Lingulodinium_polyedra.AAC.1